MSGPRLVAVLGYSERRARELHAVCASRLRQAEALARDDDVVLLSGWARGRRAAAEADLMAAAWRGTARRVLVDRRSRSTVGNVLATARAARELRAREIVLVTSRWHAARAARLLRTALRGAPVPVTVVTTTERGPRAARLRELVCWTLVPAASLAARKR